VVRFTSQFTLGVTRQYTHWSASWEVYVGPLAGNTQDGLFLYDRASGEARVVSYTSDLQLAHFQFLHGLAGNWQVSLGDFGGQGRAQILLYDPSNGGAQMLALKPDLSLALHQQYTGWGTGQVVYVGHFGLSALSLMLYDPQQARSTFLAFNSALGLFAQASQPSWGKTQQILIGSFLDRTACLEQSTCTTGDDILVLDRQTGVVQQDVFSFGPAVGEFDNLVQGFLREGIPVSPHTVMVVPSTLQMLTSVQTRIREEEVY
jgi:hypothetical protein